MNRAPLRPLCCAALAALVLASGLAACGKRGGLRPPEGEESRYTYPGAYPAPASVLSPRGPAAVPPPPAPAGDISPFPNTRRRTTTHGPTAAP